jgi:hypothetical protein
MYSLYPTLLYLGQIYVAFKMGIIEGEWFFE